MHIHWFNPENDLALANGSPTYTPPKSPQLLHQAGALLPLWYGHPGDSVLCYGVNAAWYDGRCADFGIGVGLFDHWPEPGLTPDPWGWSAYARRCFLDEDFPPESLPSDESIAAIRELSHRRTAMRVAAMLRDALPDLVLAEPAYEAFTTDDAMRWLALHPAAYVKQPWSSSGRGVHDVRTVTPEAARRLVDDSIRHQGSVLLEQAYDRAVDFAVIYECSGGKCRDLGTSVFSVDGRSIYTGNLLAPEVRRLQRVTAHYPEPDLTRVRRQLCEILSRVVAPAYSGILGVDMLVDRSGMLDAVVEINLRKTMGYVANRFTELYKHPDSPDGVFRVLRTSDLTSPEAYVCADLRMFSGSMLLTPPNPHFAFAVTI